MICARGRARTRYLTAAVFSCTGPVPVPMCWALINTGQVGSANTPTIKLHGTHAPRRSATGQLRALPDARRRASSFIHRGPTTGASSSARRSTMGVVFCFLLRRRGGRAALRSAGRSAERNDLAARPGSMSSTFDAERGSLLRSPRETARNDLAARGARVNRARSGEREPSLSSLGSGRRKSLAARPDGVEESARRRARDVAFDFFDEGGGP